MNSFFLASFTLWKRELVRFYRQPSRVVGALASPLLFWILLGSGIGRSFNGPTKQGYLGYFFPGTLLMILFFTAIFSTISLIEDRKEGFMQSVLVAPVPREAIVFGKIFGGATLAVIQAILFLFLSPLMGIFLSPAHIVILIGVLFINAFMLTCLGFLMAWHFQSIQGFHAVMNLLLMPMWILSGALFPEEGAASWIRLIMQLNPLHYGLKAMQEILWGNLAGLNFNVMVSLVFSIVLFVIASAAAKRRPNSQ